VGREEHDFCEGRWGLGGSQELKAHLRKAFLDFSIFLKDSLIEIIVCLAGNRIDVNNIPLFLFQPTAFHPLNVLERL
jgi:hypothetical protein